MGSPKQEAQPPGALCAPTGKTYQLDFSDFAPEEVVNPTGEIHQSGFSVSSHSGGQKRVYRIRLPAWGCTYGENWGISPVASGLGLPSTWETCLRQAGPQVAASTGEFHQLDGPESFDVAACTWPEDKA